ncbi:hypothetical protein FHS57_004911 [Runella defluvii]|uniref:Uncharacterized protein n=1 Tax=Runella defluvii TaxID=370973 RepID=A0A7W5ZNW6_9BACT|nr:hypothetical protein [Runella defluvii]MBB3840890.1 hypothetical protein [Runella defluvii]
MNIKPLSKLFLYATVAMLMSVSCKKKDPSACGPDNGHYRYVKTIKDARADLYQSAGFVIEGGDAPLICPFQEEKILPYENTYVRGKPQPFKYRIWGRIFNCDACPTFTTGPAPFIVIDKIVKID